MKKKIENGVELLQWKITVVGNYNPPHHFFDIVSVSADSD